MSERGAITLRIDYEPRWHGFAKWRIERRTPHRTPPGSLQRVEVLDQGWQRRPRNASFKETVLS